MGNGCSLLEADDVRDVVVELGSSLKGNAVEGRVGLHRLCSLHRRDNRAKEANTGQAGSSGWIFI